MPELFIGNIFFMIRILLISLITVYLAGCVSTTEVVDGLCYNEKEGTFICDKPENRRRDIQEEKEEIEELETESLWKNIQKKRERINVYGARFINLALRLHCFCVRVELIE